MTDQQYLLGKEEDKAFKERQSMAAKKVKGSNRAVRSQIRSVNKGKRMVFYKLRGLSIESQEISSSN